MKPAAALFAAAGLLAAGPAVSDDHLTNAPEGAEVYFISPTDGETVSNPVTIRFGARGIGVAPAGVDMHGTGHHHLLINVEPDAELLSESLPADDRHVHFGGGQTEATLDLPSGRHRLQLLMGDMNHGPHAPPVMSEPIFVTVE